MERSLVLIKPDAMERQLGGAILTRLQQLGLKLTALKMLRVDEGLAQRHYAACDPFNIEKYVYKTERAAGRWHGRKKRGRVGGQAERSD